MTPICRTCRTNRQASLSWTPQVRVLTYIRPGQSAAAFERKVRCLTRLSDTSDMSDISEVEADCHQSTLTGTTPCPDTSATPHVHLERTATVTPSDVSLHVLGSTRSERGCRTETDRSATSRCTDRHGATCPAQSTATNADATSARPEPGTDTAFDHRGWGRTFDGRRSAGDRLQSSSLSSSISASAAGVGAPL